MAGKQLKVSPRRRRPRAAVGPRREALPTWDLTDLFGGIEDPRIESTVRASLARAEAFERTYRGKITGDVGAELLLAALREYEAILQESDKSVIFAGLVFEGDASLPEHGAFLQRMRTAAVEVRKHLIFFELELIALDEEVIRRLQRDPLLANYAHYLHKQTLFKPHRLSEPEEKLLSDKSLTGRSAFTRLFDQELALKRYTYRLGRRRKEMTEAEILDLLRSPKRPERKAAAESLTAGLREDVRRLTYITNILIEDKGVDDRYRRFARPEAGRHLSNEIDQETVDVMSGVVASNYGIVHDFYRFKRRLLGLRTLYDYDRYAPVGETTVTIPWRRARDIVLDAFGKFSPVVRDAAAAFFEWRWIDAPPRAGKTGGAFCQYTTPDLHPYVLMNYTGKLNSVLTLAHELGHGVHAYLARQQTYLNFHWPLTIAETASVFGEMLVFDLLKDTLPPGERFAFYWDKLEGMFATVFRQIVMYRFEQDVHRLRREKGELTTDEISALWHARQREMFADSVTLTPNYAIWWSYIPHFVHVPFYVYAYAFGELLTLALYAQYKREGRAFVDKYLDLLRAGGSKSPQALVAPMAIDLRSADFWQGGIDITKQLIADAIALRPAGRSRASAAAQA